VLPPCPHPWRPEARSGLRLFAGIALLIGLAAAGSALAALPPGASPDSIATPDSSGAAGPEAAGASRSLVGALEVVGNRLTDNDRILRSFGVASGARYAPDAVKRGIFKLAQLGLFSDVWVERSEHDGVVDLKIHVTERPRIARIDFSGNRKKESSELEKKLSLHAGEVYSPTAVQTQIDSLVRFYREEGFSEAHVSAALDTTAGPNQVAVRFTVEEGEKLQITRIVFVGAAPEYAAKLKKQLKSKARGFFGGGGVKEDQFDEDQQKLEAWYHSQGYRDMRVVSHQIKPGDTPRHVTLEFTIDQGPRYQLGDVTWSGNTVVPTADLVGGIRVRPLGRYDASKLDRLRASAYGDYAERGYLGVTIEPRETVRDSVVDVRFEITEGQPSMIRYVLFEGNKNTREKVLRRELAIHEGERFQRSALMRSRDNLMRLGLFEDVAPDVGPADSSDVDLILKVKEKQVGTASAGAGFTGATGLTGFLELGHNNVLGNGQSLSLHLERGSKVSDYLLSFTEPWFRDTPTLLGFSVYNSSVVRDFYRERRKGGSARIGRPLAWPDYSRGAVTYRLENVTIDDVDTVAARIAGTTAQTLATIQSGQAQLTSSTLFDFTRNSTDQPMYPTRGTRLIASSEFAGGPLGGSIEFNKQRLEGRWYLPGAFKHATTMMRARFGFLGRFPSEGRDVPIYERFRLGGGATLDPLRGYDDYQVVPGKYVHDAIVDSVLDHVTVVTPGDTVRIYRYGKERVRYPGGRFFTTYSLEQQFPIVNPMHGVLFFDAGNTWDLFHEMKPFDLLLSAGVGVRLEIPLLGNVGFDWGYGFNRDDGARGKVHFLLGNVNF